MSQLKNLLSRHEISPKKSLGQHFVTDPNTILRVLEFSQIQPDDYVIEVGAGCGALTLELAKASSRLTAIETDAKLLPALKEALGDQLERINLIHGDALKLNLTELLVPNQPYKLIANLPYNIAAKLILNVLENVPNVSELTVMVQKEVAERFLAKPGTNFAMLSLKAQYFAEITSGGKISPSVFYPKPAVDSALLRLVRKPDPGTHDPQHIFELASLAFSKRRKMLRKSLASKLDSKDFEALSSMGVEGTSRPQDLSFTDWAAISTQIVSK